MNRTTWTYDPSRDPHRHRDDLHYRIVRSGTSGTLTVACLQWFDYPDYDNSQFVDDIAYDDEDKAWTALYNGDYTAAA